MKMLNNVLGADVFATSRTPIQSPRSTKMGEGDRRCAARPPDRPTQVHPDHHAEDGAVAEHVDGVEHADGAYAREQKGYKNSVLPPTVPKCVAVVDTRWPLDGNANAPRLDIVPPPNDHGVVKWGVSRRLSLWGLAKPAMGSPKP